MPVIRNTDPYPWPHDGTFDPGQTALVIIDMQRDFCDPQGYMATAGYDTTGAASLIPGISRLRRAMADWGALIIHTREGHRPDLSDLPSAKRFRSRAAGAEIGSDGPLGRLLVRGEPGWDIVPELRPGAGEPIIDKPGYGAFRATDLHRILGTRSISKLVLCGVTTDVCVSSTLRDAVDLGYECLTITDCCWAASRASHEATFATIRSEGGIFGAVACCNDVIANLAPPE